MMKTQTNQSNPGKQLALLAALSLIGTTLALPAFAHGQKSGAYRSYNSGNGYYSANHGGRYARLNRINSYGVRGRIVAWGYGPYEGCFRVKRTGYYHGESAIVTVRYCRDHYGQSYIVKGSKLLVKYLNYYRPAKSYNYRSPMRGY